MRDTSSGTYSARKTALFDNGAKLRRSVFQVASVAGRRTLVMVLAAMVVSCASEAHATIKMDPTSRSAANSHPRNPASNSEYRTSIAHPGPRLNCSVALGHETHGDNTDSRDYQRTISGVQRQHATARLAYMQQRSTNPASGRFLSADPVTPYAQPGANFNRYWYANNNPYTLHDPDGRAAIITYKQNGSINIQVPIAYSGPANTQTNRNAVAADIASHWSGTYNVGGRQTRVNVAVVPVDSRTPASAVNSISLLSGPTSNAQTQGASFVRGGNTGEWNMSSPGIQAGEVAHEAGHLMGARDHYVTTTNFWGNRVTKAAPGYEGNLMGQLPGTPDSRVMREILVNPSNTVIRESPPPPEPKKP